MFWKCREKGNKDGVQKLFELTQAERSKDPWHLAVLDEDRNGAETWETYCFVHGLPTCNPGSWLPGTTVPQCGDKLCATLRVRWELLWRRNAMTWSEMQAMECATCHAERQRRLPILFEVEQWRPEDILRLHQSRGADVLAADRLPCRGDWSRKLLNR